MVDAPSPPKPVSKPKPSDAEMRRLREEKLFPKKKK